MMGRNDPTEILQEIDGINLVLSIWSEREIEMGSRIARLGQGFEVGVQNATFLHWPKCVGNF